TLNALAKYGYNHLFQAIEDKLLQNNAEIIQTFNAQGLANTLNAYSHCPGDWRRLFEAIAIKLLQNNAEIVQKFTDQGLANTLSSFVDQIETVQPLFKAIQREVSKRDLRKFDLQSLCNLAWAFVVVNGDCQE